MPLCNGVGVFVTPAHRLWLPTMPGTGKGGECISGGKMDDEFHPELKVCVRVCVCVCVRVCVCV